MTFFSVKKLKKEHFFSKNNDFSLTFAFILNHYYDGDVHTYAATEELQKMEFRINTQNI